MRRLLLLGTLVSGCASFSTLHTARPVKNGETSFGGSLTLTRLPAEFFEENPSPTIELYGRMGMSDSMDVGVKLFPAGLMLDGNIMVWSNKNMVLSVDPTLGAAVYDWDASKSFYGTAWLPVLFDYDGLGGPGKTLTAGVKVGTLVFYGPEIGEGGAGGGFDPAAKVLFGFNLAYRLAVGPVKLAPEVALLFGNEVLTYNVVVGIEPN